MMQTDLRSASGMMSRLDFKHALENRGSKAIPCVIHQTAKTHTLKEQEAKWAQTWKDMTPKCEYKLWNLVGGLQHFFFFYILGMLIPSGSEIFMG